MIFDVLSPSFKKKKFFMSNSACLIYNLSLSNPVGNWDTDVQNNREHLSSLKFWSRGLLSSELEVTFWITTFL
jgi:hypothetical protein